MEAVLFLHSSAVGLSRDGRPVPSDTHIIHLTSALSEAIRPKSNVLSS